MMGWRAEVKKRKSWIWVGMGILAACAVIKWYSCSVAKSAYYLQQTNTSDCTRWRFICCNRKIAKSTVSAFPADCNLLARSKRECLSLAWYSAASAILKRRAPRRGLCGFDGREGLDREFHDRFPWIRDRRILKFHEFDSSLNARVQRI